jgi:hypothetical protein
LKLIFRLFLFCADRGLEDISSIERLHFSLSKLLIFKDLDLSFNKFWNLFVVTLIDFILSLFFVNLNSESHQEFKQSTTFSKIFSRINISFCSSSNSG